MWNKIESDGLTIYQLESTKYLYQRQSEDDSDHLNSQTRDVSLYGPYIRTEVPVEGNTSDLPSGLYRYYKSSSPHLAEVKLDKFEKILDLQVIEKVKRDFKEFIDSKERVYKVKNMPFKQGVLLYGPPGTGKTSAINQLIADNMFNDTIIIYCEDLLTLPFRNKLHDDPRLKIIIFEELLTTVKNTNLQKILDFLDGSTSMDNMFVIATTNYPELLPSNVADRPGRFDTLYKIDYLTDEDKRTYYRHVIGEELTDQEVEMLGDLTIASFKEIILLTLRRDLTLIAALKVMQDQSELVRSKFKERSAEEVDDDTY